MEIADSTRFEADVHDAYFRLISDPDITWLSTATNVATVRADGVVHSIAPGSTTVRAAIADLADSVHLDVLSPAAAVEITGVPDSLIDPTTSQLIGVARNAGGDVLPSRSFYWTSSDTTVATVYPAGETGSVTTKGPGTVTITARSTAVTASASLNILPAVAEVLITGSNGQVPIGSSVQLSATTRDRLGNVLTGRPVRWTAESYYSISVSEEGLALAHAGGPGVVTAHSEQVTADIDLQAVMDAPLRSVGLGFGHACGLTEEDHVYCWGHGTEGRLGEDHLDVRSTPVPVALPRTFASLFVGGMHTCGLDETGAAFCWGANEAGQLGQPLGRPGAVEAVSGGLTFTTLAIGDGFTCGLTAAQRAYCWGSNSQGELGRGTTDEAVHSTPEPIAGNLRFTRIRASSGRACGLTATGEAHCWGWNAGGMLGIGTDDDLVHPVPTQIPGITFTDLALSSVWRSCGISTAGPVYCWGNGQRAPALLDASTGYTKIDAGAEHFCRMDTGGRLSCWGELTFYNLGYRPSQPLTDFALGSHTTCAIPVVGKVTCWGLNDGWQLGEVTESSGPIEVNGQPE
jgi:alpha-tubulin suppressor-like RCC1 family protein